MDQQSSDSLEWARRAAVAAELFEKWSKPLRKLLNSTNAARPGDIDDVAQETFVRLLRYGDQNLEDPLRYLYRIAVNVANEARERCVNRLPHIPDDILEEMESEWDHPESITEQDDSDRRVREAIDALPARSRHVLVLHVYEGLTYRQIADRLGLTHRMVMRDLVRANSELREVLLEEIWIHHKARRRTQAFVCGMKSVAA
jgi:RNA polymerase sigma factor (sigma-70 family)